MKPVKKVYSNGQFIFHEGEAPKAIFLISRGAVSIRKTKGLRTLEIARLHEGEVLGELSFFDRQPRSAAAVAIAETEITEIPFESLDKIYEGVPSYIKTIIAAVATRLRKANETLQRLQKASTTPVIPDEEET